MTTPLHLKLLSICPGMDAYKAAGNSVDIYGSDCSCGCVHFHKLDGQVGMDWGVCTEPRSPRAGLLTFEHMGCQFFVPEPDDEAV